MSSIDMSDPHISMAYNALQLNDPLRWCVRSAFIILATSRRSSRFLLAHGNRPNVLVLCASGTGDLDELRAHLTPENVSYGLFREQHQDKLLHVLLNYIPDSVKGVWRGELQLQLMMASRMVYSLSVLNSPRIGQWESRLLEAQGKSWNPLSLACMPTLTLVSIKVNQVLTVSNPDQVTVQALRHILRLPPRVPHGPSSSPLLGPGERSNVFLIPRKPTPVAPSASATLSTATLSTARPPSPTPVDIALSYSRLVDSQPPSPRSIDPQASSTSTEVPSLYTAPSATRPTSPPPIPSQPQSPLVASPISIHSDPESHPPISPHQTSWLTKQASPLPPPPPSKSIDELQDVDRKSNSDGRPSSSHLGSIPDSNSVESFHIVNHAPSPEPSSFDPQSADNDSSRFFERKPSPRTASPASPPNIALSNSTRYNSIDNSSTNKVATGDPAASNKSRTRFQDRAVSAADAEEEKKLIVLEEERRRRAAERARREREEREEEEAREREFEKRKEREKKRRLESARRAEEQRAEQKRQQEEEEARRRAEKEHREAELRQRRSRIKQRFEKKTGMDLLSGFITLESSSSWKRRYYRLSTEDWIFFKNDKASSLSRIYR